MRVEKVAHTDLSDQALEYLIKSHQRGFVTDSFINVLQDSEIHCFYDGDLKGVLAVDFHDNIMNVSLFGGNDMKSWKEFLWSWAMNFMKEKELDHLCVIGRQGWSEIFPELKPKAVLYTFSRGK